MNPFDYKGYKIYQPTSGGKAGTGRNKTSSIQVRKNNMIVKQFRYDTEKEDNNRTITRAMAWVDEQEATAGLKNFKKGLR